VYKNKTFIAVIPARGGSKRLPRKNILNLNGKPLIAHTIQAALFSKYIDETVVTTDDQEIFDIAKKYGASVPFLRPNELSDDVSTRSSVVKHTIEFYKNNLQKKFDYIVYLQPTSPLRTEVEIDNAIEYMHSKKSDAVVSVCELEHPFHWSGALPENKDMSKFLGDVAIRSRSQDLEIFYRLNGAIYICNSNKFLEQGCMFLKENIYAFKMDQKKSVDIDTKDDFEYVEFLINK
jgi:CMP-N,N'-diacetyllegionaminic acid synthase